MSVARRHALWLLALGLTVLAQVELWTFRDTSVARQPIPIVLLLLMTLPLGAAARFPLAVLLVTGLAALLHLAFAGDTLPALAGPILACLFLAQWGDGRSRILGGTLVLLALAATLAVLALRGTLRAGDATLDLMVFAAAWILGDDLRQRREKLEALEARADRLERERIERDRRAAEAERARLARELHDVVAHSVSVMTLQAGAARRVAAADATTAIELLRSIEVTGRHTAADLRRTLLVLRSGESEDARAPQPVLRDLPALVDSIRSAGLEVGQNYEGLDAAVPPGLQLAAYRIVQEALTNVIKHAGASSASVEVRVMPAELVIEVTDDGRVQSSLGPDSGRLGHGLAGMRERVALYGGTLEAGPAAAGGFRVLARLSIGEPV